MLLGLILAAHCVFSPPADWEVADPKMPTRRGIVGFINKSKTGFCPSIHLTHETTKASVDEYLKQIKNVCFAKRYHWRHIGKISTLSGDAELIEIETKTKFGPARLFQALLFKDDDVFVLTASALKSEFGKYAPQMQETIRSMSICEDLLDLVEDETQKQALQEAWQKRSEGLKSNAYEQMVLEQSLGVVWKLQMLKR